MSEHEMCPTCGAKMVEYRHGMAKALASALVNMAERTGGNTERAYEISELGMDYNHRCNFQKLRYWDAIEKVGDPDGKGGRWRLTQVGMSFVLGNTEVPKTVTTYRGEVVSVSEKTIHISKCVDGWTYRPEWARSAAPHAEIRQGELTLIAF